MISSKMDNLDICPECSKPVKHLNVHLKNEHKWRTTTFKDNMKELENAEAHPVYPLTPDPKNMDRYGEEKYDADVTDDEDK